MFFWNVKYHLPSDMSYLKSPKYSTYFLHMYQINLTVSPWKDWGKITKPWRQPVCKQRLKVGTCRM
jgi:hypothetical protein